MIKHISPALIAGISISLLSGCMMKTAKQESWINPEFEGQSIGKTMVLATADSESICRQYEALFVEQLLPFVSAGSLHASQDLTGKIEEENLKALLKGNDVKTIIITGVLDGTQRDQIVTIGYNSTPYSGGYWGHYNYGYSITANSATVSTHMEYVLETNVYDVETEKLIWSGRKSIFDDRSNMQNMKIIISNVVKDLEKRRLLK
jgi:hypothetical protein